MRYIFMILLLALNISSFGNPIYEQLITLNKCWLEKSNVDLSGYDNRNLKTETDWIRLHLTLVEKTLGNRDISILSPSQQQNRVNTLNILHEYMLAGYFPKNEDINYRTPIFIDKYNNFCAVGYLIKATGHEPVSRKIAANTNLAYVKDMDYPELQVWAKDYGFTIDELAWIQPGYGPKYSEILPVGKGTNGIVEEMYVDNDSNRLYFGGTFTKIDSVINTSNIGYLTRDGNRYVYHKMGKGLNGTVLAITKFNNNIYAAGAFAGGASKLKSNIAMWNGIAWSAVGCLTGDINELIEYKGKLYAAGRFHICNTATNVNFAFWDGNNWVPVNGLSGTVNTMQVYDGKLYIGGEFSYGSVPANVIRWTQANGFESFSNAIANEVLDFEVFYDTMYASCKKVTGDTALLLRQVNNNWVGYSNFKYYPSNSKDSVALSSICVLGDTFLIGGNFDAYPKTMHYAWNSIDLRFAHLPLAPDNYFLSDVISKMVVFDNAIFVGSKTQHFARSISRRVYTNVPNFFYADLYANVSCNGKDGRLAVVNIRGGTPPFKFLWSTGDTTSSIIAPAGQYSVVVIDKNFIQHHLSTIIEGTVIDTSIELGKNYAAVKDTNDIYQWLWCGNNGYSSLPGETSWSLFTGKAGYYSVAIERDGCLDTSACHGISLQVETVRENTVLDIYPNPATQQLIISFEKVSSIRELIVVDISGRLCIKQLVPAIINKVDVHALTNGTYSLIIEEDGRKQYGKFVKE